MSSASQSPTDAGRVVPGGRSRRPGSGSKLRRASEISLTTPGLDLSARLRVFQRALRSRVERRDALDRYRPRASTSTLEPPKIAEVIRRPRVDAGCPRRAGPWYPPICPDSCPCSPIAASHLTWDRRSTRSPNWVMHRGQEFVTADLTPRSRA